MQKSKKTLIVIEAGHLSKIAVSGGEMIMQHIAKYLKSKYAIIVILPTSATKPWHGSKKISFIKLPPNIFEKNNNPVFIFFNYLIRAIKTFLILKSQFPNSTIYSSTNSFVDTTGPYLLKITGHKFKWIARVHHLTENPSKREGNFFVNMLSFLLDRLSLNQIKKADITITLNPLLYKKLASFGFRKKNLETLGGGADPTYFKKPHIQKPWSGIFLGRLHRTKGVLDLPNIWLRVIKSLPNATLAIVGEKSDSKLYKQLGDKIKTLALDDKIKVLGFVSESEVATLLSNSKVFLFTDHEAGFSLATAEAMASGLPIVGYDIGILGSVFKKGFLKVPFKNLDAFSDQVIRILKSKTLHQKLSIEAKEEASNHNWQTVAMKFEKILDTISS